MRIKEISQLTGLSQKTIRYYEAQGLIAPNWENKNGKRFRDYSQTDLDDLNHIAALRRAMFTIDEIRTMQDEPERIPSLVTDYRRRMEALAEEAIILVRASRRLDQSSLMDYKTLADDLEQAAARVVQPENRSVEPHFGKFDPEFLSAAEQRRIKQDQENKKAAIIWYNMTSKNQYIPANRPEATGLMPTSIQRMGIITAMQDDWDEAKDFMKGDGPDA